MIKSQIIKLSLMLFGLLWLGACVPLVVPLETATPTSTTMLPIVLESGQMGIW